MKYCEDVNCTKFGEPMKNGQCFGGSIVNDGELRELYYLLIEKRDKLNRQIEAISASVLESIQDKQNAPKESPRKLGGFFLYKNIFLYGIHVSSLQYSSSLDWLIHVSNLYYTFTQVV